MPAFGGESDQPDCRAAGAGWTSAAPPGTQSDAGEASPEELASWYRRDDRGDLDEAIWDEDLDPSCGPPADEEPRLAGLGVPNEPRPVHEVLAAGFTHRNPGAPGAGFAAGGALDLLAPGPALAGFAAEAADGGYGGLSDDELIGLLCAWRRLGSWAAAGEVRAVCELGRRRQVQARVLANRHLIDHVGDELAAALTLTCRSADRLLDLSAGLRRLGPSLRALAEGRIDWQRATVLADELGVLDDAAAAEVEAKVLPRAGELTTAQLRAALRRAILAVDPLAAERRRRTATKEARVETWDETSGNSALAGRDLPPAEVIAADQRLTALARWLHERGALGTIAQLRAAVFTAVLAGRPVGTLLPVRTPDRADGAAPGPGDLAAPGGQTAGPAWPGAGPWPDLPLVPPGISGSVNLTMPMSSWLGLSEAPGEVAGYGPVDAASCRDLAAELAAGRAVRWHLTLTGPDGRAVAHACARAGPGPPGTVPVQWLASLKVTVLESGTCTHQREAASYRPPRSLRHLIEIRQRTCGYPGCRRPAIRCDLDHTVPYDQGGRTCECGLAVLCRRHHQAKGLPGWQLSQDQPGTLGWHLPSGRAYTTRPAPYPV